MKPPIFDFHARLGPQPGAVERLLSTMDEYGIARAAVAAGGVVDLDRLSHQIIEGGQAHGDADNAAVLAAGTAAAGRLVPFYFGNPHDTSGAYRAAVGEFRGLEISPAVHGVGFDDERVHRLVAVAAAAGHPVYAVGVVTRGGRTGDFVGLARCFPETTFVFGHCGFIGVDIHGINAIAPYPNIVAETSGCFTVVARFAVDRLGPHRVLFGTEFPLQHPSVELAKFAALDLDPASWRQIAWDNAHRLLAEETP
jgi:uncharacterized protein